MSRETTLKRILDGGIVAVVRSESSASLVKVVQALAEGGVTAAEITFMPSRGLPQGGRLLPGGGGRLVEPKAITTGDFTRIRELACQYAAIVTRVRETR